MCCRWVAEPGEVRKDEDEVQLRSWVVGEKQWQWGNAARTRVSKWGGEQASGIVTALEGAAASGVSKRCIRGEGGRVGLSYLRR